MTQRRAAHRRNSFSGWESLLGLDGSAPPAVGQGAEGQAVVYLRVSDPRQMLTAIDIDADGNSIATQREACVVRAERAKAPIAQEFIEPGNSAQSIGKRPVFREMLRYIEHHPEVSYVVIYMRSRAFRNLADAAITKRILASMGVKLISAKEDFGEGYMADAMEAVTDIMNEVQVRQSGEDIKQKMLHKAMSGGTTGRAKIGYLNVRKDFDGRLVNTIDVDPQRAPYIRWAFEQYATGEVSMSMLRERLSEQGLTTRPTAKWKEGPLSLNQLSLILRDPYYVGMVTYKGQIFDGRHEALVSAETFERVQEVLAARRRPVQRDQVHAHFLRGLMCCDRCNAAGREHRMIYTEANNGNGQCYGYYLCRGRQETTCDLPHLPVGDVERAVARAVKALALDPEFVVELKRHVHEALIVQQQGERDTRTRLAAQLKKLEVQESNLLDIAADGELAADAVKARLRALAVQRRAVVDKLARSDELIQRHADMVLTYLDLLARPYSFYVSASESIKRRILEAFFSCLWIEDESHQVSARGQVHEPIALIQAAAAEWAATKAKSASDTADALDSTPSNLYLKAICSSKTGVVGPEGLEPSTRGLKVRCSTD